MALHLGETVGSLQDRPEMHILCLSTTDTGHLNPIIRVARGLVDAGHRVSLPLPDSWLNSEEGGAGRFKEELKGFNLIALPMPAGMGRSLPETLEFIKEESAIWMPWNLMKRRGDIYKEATYSILDDLKKHAFDYAVIDFFSLHFVAPVQELGVDFCVNLPGPAALLWFFEHEGTEDRSWMPWSLVTEFLLLKNSILSSIVADHKAGLSSIKPWLVNSFPGLEIIPEGELPDYCEYTGSLAKSEKRSKMSARFEAFVSSGEPVVCVSLGSMLVPDRVIVNAIYEALAGGPWKVVWSLKKWSIQECLPEGVDERQFLIAPWIPQAAVLAHPSCKAFITHGGWGGIMEAAAAAMPCLVLPFLGDQPTNAALIEAAGWGLALPRQGYTMKDPMVFTMEPPEYTGKLSAAEVREKVQLLIGDPSFQEAAALVQQGSNERGGSRRAAELVLEWASLHKKGFLPEMDESDSECGCF